MKRDTGDEIRMKLRYGRSNPWFSIRRVLSLPPSCRTPCYNLSVCRIKGVQPRIPRGGRDSFFLVFPFPFLPLSLFLLFSRGNSRSVFNIFQNSPEQKAVSSVEIRIHEGEREG